MKKSETIGKLAEHIGTIQSAGWQAKKSGEGKTFKMELANPKWSYNLFDPGQQKFAGDNIGARVKVSYEDSEDGKYRNVKNIEAAPQETHEAMSKADWERKDILITRTAIAKSLLEGPGFDLELANKVFAWVVGQTTAPAPEMTQRESPKAKVLTVDKVGVIKDLKAAIKAFGCTEVDWCSGRGIEVKPWTKYSLKELNDMLENAKQELADWEELLEKDTDPKGK